MQLKDPESGKYVLTDTSDRLTRMAYEHWWKRQQEKNAELFRKVGVDVADLYTDRDYVKELIALFKRR